MQESVFSNVSIKLGEEVGVTTMKVLGCGWAALTKLVGITKKNHEDHFYMLQLIPQTICTQYGHIRTMPPG